MSDDVNAAVTLVIPARNAGPVLRQCLDAVMLLHKQGELHEIILVDDGSTDNTAEVAQQYGVRVIRGVGGGPGAARNLGWQAATAPLVWFIDSDCVAEPNALQLLLPHMAEEAVAGVGGSYGNMLPNRLLACLIHEEIMARHAKMPSEVNFLASFNVLYRREALAELNGFDERHTNGPGRAGAEDAELAFRLRAAGHRLRFEPNSKVKHFHPTKLVNYLKTQARHGYFRVMLYRLHPGRMQGDSYSNSLDHIQPPLAMLILASLPLLIWPIVRWIPGVLIVLLFLLQIPLTMRLVSRTGQLRYLWFAPMNFLRSFARGIGLTLGVLSTLTFRRQAKCDETRRCSSRVGDKFAA